LHQHERITGFSGTDRALSIRNKIKEQRRGTADRKENQEDYEKTFSGFMLRLSPQYVVAIAERKQMVETDLAVVIHVVVSRFLSILLSTRSVRVSSCLHNSLGPFFTCKTKLKKKKKKKLQQSRPLHCHLLEEACNMCLSKNVHDGEILLSQRKKNMRKAYGTGDHAASSILTSWLGWPRAPRKEPCEQNKKVLPSHYLRVVSHLPALTDQIHTSWQILGVVFNGREDLSLFSSFFSPPTASQQEQQEAN
jgi:hypothetical protein